MFVEQPLVLPSLLNIYSIMKKPTLVKGVGTFVPNSVNDGACGLDASAWLVVNPSLPPSVGGKKQKPSICSSFCLSCSSFFFLTAGAGALVSWLQNQAGSQRNLHHLSDVCSKLNCLINSNKLNGMRLIGNISHYFKSFEYFVKFKNIK